MIYRVSGRLPHAIAAQQENIYKASCNLCNPNSYKFMLNLKITQFSFKGVFGIGISKIKSVILNQITKN